jgi:hypothetical protein
MITKSIEMAHSAAETVRGVSVLIGGLTAISREITGEGNGAGMKN